MSIEIKGIKYTYDLEDPKSSELGIFDISLNVAQGETIGVIGHTGSGKSTLVQHLNGLYLPQEGTIQIDDLIINKNSKKLKALRQKVGMVFQYPEDQLFEETVEKDVSFGPGNIGMTEEEIKKSVEQALNDLGLSLETYGQRSPYELSGGEKRKVAIASVLAMNPEVLVLDEPTAGLDPKSKKELLELLFKIKRERNLTVFFVSHDMDDIFLLADRVIVLSKGRLVLEGTPKEVFAKKEYLYSLGLGVPFTVEIVDLLEQNGFDLRNGPYYFEELADKIMGILGGVK